jgi:hypothetical protein
MNAGKVFGIIIGIIFLLLIITTIVMTLLWYFNIIGITFTDGLINIWLVQSTSPPTSPLITNQQTSPSIKQVTPPPMQQSIPPLYTNYNCPTGYFPNIDKTDYNNLCIKL